MNKKNYIKSSERIQNKQHFVESNESLSPLQWMICLFVVIMPLLFCKWNDQSPFEMIKAYFSTVVITTIAGLFLVSRIFKEKIEIRYNMWVWGLLIYLAAYWLSFAFAGHHYSSLWGVLNLPAGSVMTVTSFVVMSLIAVQIFTHENSIKRLAFCFVFCTFLMSVYGIIQHFGGDPINWWAYSAMNYRALSTMGQSVGFGTVVGCCLPLCFAFLISATNRKMTFWWTVVFVCMNFGILYSGSRLPIFAYFLTMLIFLVFLGIFKSKLPAISWKRIIMAYAIIILANIIYFTEPGINSLKQKLVVSELKNGYSTRFIVWGTAFEIWKKHPILGVGPENFGEEFNHLQTVEQNYGESWRLIWHKAHNEFIHYLATTGVVGFAAYFWLIILMFIPVFRILFKKEWKTDYVFSVALLGGFGFLLATHMTAFSFIPTLMFFYIFPVMNFKLNGDNKVITIENKLNPSLRWMFAITFGVISILIVNKVYSVWSADMHYNDSRRQLVGAGNVDAAKDLLEKAINNNPDNAEYWCFRSDIYYNLLVRSFRTQNDSAVPLRQAYFKEVIGSSDKCVSLDGRKSDLWRARGTLFLSLSQIDPKALDISLEAYKKAVEVYPNNPFTQLSLAAVYRRMNRPELAIESLRKSITLRKDIVPAFAELMNIYYSQKRPDAIASLVTELKGLNMKASEFYPEVPSLIKIAQDNQDTATQQALMAL